MMEQSRIASLFPLLLALGGCATLSQEQCVNEDWYDLGMRDGAAGYPPEQLAEHRQACSEYRIRPDREAYRAGWEEGIRNYCTPERGFREGRAGVSYAQICPPRLERAFLREYRIGRDLYEQERRIRDMERDREERRREYDRGREDRRRSEDRRERPDRPEKPERDRDIQPVGPPVRLEKPDRPSERPEDLRRRDVQPVEQPALFKKPDQPERAAIPERRNLQPQLQPQPAPNAAPDESAEKEKLRQEMQKAKERFNRLREQPDSNDTAP